jgi:hypothetical protein
LNKSHAGDALANANKVLRLASNSDPSISIMIPPLVSKELERHISAVVSETSDHLSSMDRQIGVAHIIASSFGADVPEVMYSNLQIIEVLHDLSRGLLDKGIMLDPDDTIMARAAGRAIQPSPPASKGKIQDCIIYMHCLEVFTQLREKGFEGNCVFMTSNTKDFCDRIGVVKEPIRSELDKRSITFVKGWAGVISALGISSVGE